MLKLPLGTALVTAATALAACALGLALPPAAAAPNLTDWGVLTLTNGVAIQRPLADGRLCCITATALPFGAKRIVALSPTNSARAGTPTSLCPQAQLTFSIAETNSARLAHSFSETSELLLDQPSILVLEQTNLIHLTAHLEP